MINKNKQNKRIAIALAGVVFLCLVAGGGWYYYNQLNKNNNPNQKNPITEADTNSESTTNSGEPTPSSTTQQSVPGSVTITGLSQIQDGVMVSTLVNGIKKGTCTVVFERSGVTVQETAPVGLQVSYYLCKGFNPVTISKFSQKGEWSTYVRVNDGSTEVRSNTQTININ